MRSHLQMLPELLAGIDLSNSNTSDFWRSACESLIESCASDSDAANHFLRWPAIRKTMHIGNGPMFEKAYRYLCNHIEWRSRWSRAIEEVDIGDPIPFVMNLNASPTSVQQTYNLALFKDYSGVDFSALETIIEIGGGYGSQCRILHKLGFKGRYLIFDIEPFSIIQRCYLGEAGIAIDDDLDEWSNVFCSHKVDEFRKACTLAGPSSALLAMWSLSEMPIPLRNDLLHGVPAPANIMMAYQAEFTGLDNVKWFETFSERLSKVRRWVRTDRTFQDDNFYLFGFKP